jgi:GT2 family glycosyltransferase
MNKPLSILIISYNRPHDLLECLIDISRLNNLDLLDKVIILNNKSTVDYSIVQDFIYQHKHIPFEYLEAPENLGIAQGRNYITSFAKSDLLIYFDDDIRIEDPALLDKIFGSFTQNKGPEKLGVISFRVLYHSNRQMEIRAFPHKNLEKYKHKKDFLTYYYTGCAHLIAREAWYKTEGYPKNFGYGAEEYDLSYQILEQDYAIKHDASLVIYHKVSPLGRATKAENLQTLWLNKSSIAFSYLPKQYFYSTTLLWSLFFLAKTKFNFRLFFKAWQSIFALAKHRKRQVLSKKTLAYLKKVEARLWY